MTSLTIYTLVEKVKVKLSNNNQNNGNIKHYDDLEAKKRENMDMSE